MNTGIIVLFIVFVLVLVLYGTLLFLNKTTDSQIASTKQQFDSEYSGLVQGNAKTVADFQNRLDFTSKSIIQSRDAKSDLEAIEKLMVPGAFLNEYKYDDTGKILTLSCIGDSFNTVAKQILSFKKSDYFSNVSSGQTSGNASNNDSGNQGGINFVVTLTLK
jgi:hypothetical protein